MSVDEAGASARVTRGGARAASVCDAGAFSREMRGRAQAADEREAGVWARELRGRARAKVTKYYNRIATLEWDLLTPFDKEVWQRKVEKVAALYQQWQFVDSAAGALHVQEAEDAASQLYDDRLKALQQFVQDTTAGENERPRYPEVAPTLPTGLPVPVPHQTNMRVKLPSIVIPSFYGDVLQWSDFIATFDL